MTSPPSTYAAILRALCYGLAGVAGCSAGLLAAVACTPEIDHCKLDRIETVEPEAGYCHVTDWRLPYPALLDAEVYAEGNLVSMTWIEGEVEHKIVWQIASYNWENLWN